MMSKPKEPPTTEKPPRSKKPSESKEPTPAADDKVQLPAIAGTDIAIAAAFPGETPKSGDAQVNRYAAAIVHDWRGTVKSIVQVATTCAEAFASLDQLQQQKLYELLPFSKATFSKLASIGKSDALLDLEVQEHVPPSWSIMYQLTHLTPEEARKAIADEVLTPDATRAELNTWIAKNCHSRKNRKRGERKPTNDAVSDALLRRLIEAFKASPNLMAVWNECSAAVRKRFAHALPKLV